ncbi:MAG: MFS transporter [Burkholderiales bacterium]
MKRNLFYGWYIAAAGAGTNFFVLGITFFGFGVFLEAFRETYGWSVTAIALGYSIRTLELGLLAPLTGYIADRLGPRKMAVTGVTIMSLSLVMFWQATTLPLYYAACIVMGIGQSIGGPNAFSLAIMRWFVRKRGQAMSVITTGNGFGYFSTLILAATIGAFGFHEAFLVLAAAIFIGGLPLALVIRDRPEDMGLAPDGEPSGADGGKGGKRAAGGLEVQEAMRTPAFYLLVLGLAAGAAAQLVWIVFQVPHLRAAGFSLGFVGVMAAAYGMAAIPLRWAVGWLGDRFGRKQAYMFAVTLEGIGLCFFAFITPERWWLFIPFFLTFGIGHAGWLVLQHTLIADFFGSKRFATLRGFANAFQIPVSVIVPVFMGYAFDTTGTYQLALLVIAGIVTAGALSLALIRRPMWIDTAAPAGASVPASKAGSQAP